MWSPYVYLSSWPSSLSSLKNKLCSRGSQFSISAITAFLILATLEVFGGIKPPNYGFIPSYNNISLSMSESS